MENPPALAARPGRVLDACLALLAVAAIAAPALIVWRAPAVPHYRLPRPMAQRVVPKAELPPVEPVAFQDLAPDDARAFNATVPFVDGPVPPARAFRFAGTSDARARAADCLATAVLFEAGDDTLGQRAVAQVVLNRVRHPAFPKTVCGVVFQGSERPTGCQFTFTCDGALANHRWSGDAWKRAHEVADAALSGTVFRAVGYATHYHTDWVVPYWQSSLDKIAAVHTHLFFRWTGWWGTAPAFNRAVSPDEPVIPALALISDAHKTGAALAEVNAATAQAAIAMGAVPAPMAGQDGSFIIKLDPKLTPDVYAAIATRACGERPYCKVLGWTDKARMPATLPLTPAQVGSMSFSYLRDRAHNFDKALWNCAEFKRDRTQCMKQQISEPISPEAAALLKRTMPQAVAPTPRTETFTLQALPGARVGGTPTVVPTLKKPTPSPAPVATPIARPNVDTR
jgi:spore germination cell wall hydrolase CwlJ-like protein